MERVISVCGLICSECDGYIATQAGDEIGKEHVAAHWRRAFDNPAIDAAYITCDGCLAASGRLGGHCTECDIRTCGITRGVPNCGLCPDYACARLEQFFGFMPAARATLDTIHAGART